MSLTSDKRVPAVGVICLCRSKQDLVEYCRGKRFAWEYTSNGVPGELAHAIVDTLQISLLSRSWQVARSLYSSKSSHTHGGVQLC